MKLLKELYMTNAVSGKEEPISKIVQRELTSMKIPFEVDIRGQIFSIIDDNPMLCAHMDQVQKDSPTMIVYDRGEIFGSNALGKPVGLGADDKNGIWITLKLLKKFPQSSFIFSTEEEIGGNSVYLLNEEKPESNFALVFDRKGSSDIIATMNSYCEDDLIDDLLDLSEEYEMDFKEAIGTFSDCDHINNYIPCVNISCGYHMAHTAQEYTVLSELRHSLKFGRLILEEMYENWYSRPAIQVFESMQDLVSIGGAKTNRDKYKYKFNSSAWKYTDWKKEEEPTKKLSEAYGDWLICYDCGQEYHESDVDSEETCPFCGAIEYSDKYEANKMPLVKG